MTDEPVDKHKSTYFTEIEEKTLLIDGEQHTFSSTFPMANNTSGSITYPIPAAKALLSLTIYIEDDNAGPILVNPYLQAGKYIHHLGDEKEQILSDGAGHNAERFQWTGKKPMALQENSLVILYANYSGGAIEKVSFVGIVQ